MKTGTETAKAKALDPRVRSFLETLFNRLDEEKIQYCILHSPEKIFAEVQGDIDIATDPRGFKRIPGLLMETGRPYGITPIQEFYHDVPLAKKWICATGIPGQPCLALDFVCDEAGLIPFAPTGFFLAHRRKCGPCYGLPPALEFIYYLQKKVRKGDMTADHISRLKLLYQSNSRSCDQLMKTAFGRGGTESAKRILFDPDLSPRELRARLGKLKRARLASYYLKRPGKLLLWIFWSVWRAVDRVRHPAGLIVGFISPDGGGKSTLAARLAESVGYAFDGRVSRFHWRPCLLPPPRQVFRRTPERANTDPHSAPLRPRWLSLLRFFYYYFDYLTGFYLKLFVRKVRFNLVLMDRYYYDFLIDRVRFGLDIPPWLPGLLLPTVPQVDILFFLNGNADDIYARKQEIGPPEIERQLREIRNAKPLLGNLQELDASRPLESVDREAGSVVLNYLSCRFQLRLAGAGH